MPLNTICAYVKYVLLPNTTRNMIILEMTTKCEYYRLLKIPKFSGGMVHSEQEKRPKMTQNGESVEKLSIER